MTQYNPSLLLRRLVVYRSGKTVFDQAFTTGVNIIRGQNGSGKTTVSDFIYHSLGGEVAIWREEAKSCDETVAEVEINGKVLTLRRAIEYGRQMRPMAIFWGSATDALAHAAEGWEVYPFAASANKESFSQVLLRALGLPEVQGELSSRVTMHQILRLMYVDQVTQYNEIFRADIFDNTLVREAVGDLLCGVYDARLYEIQLQLAANKAELASLDARLTGMLAALDPADHGTTSEILSSELNRKRAERNRLHDELLAPKTPAGLTAPTIEPVLRDLSEQISNFSRALLSAEESAKELQFQIADADQFVDSLKTKISALDEAAVVRESLGGMRFRFCPACYAVISDSPDGNTCHLCHTAHGTEKGDIHLLRMRQELALQIKESGILRGDRLNRLNSILSTLPGQRERLTHLQMRYTEVATGDVRFTDPAIAELHRAIGYLERELEDLAKRLTLVQLLDSVRESRAEVTAQLARLKQELNDREKVQVSRQREAYALIASLTASLLERDLRREEDFRAVESVTFDFGNNRVLANGRANYAASSMVYLKNCFHLAIILASTQAAYFRYPRFGLFDNIEDKGMEPARSHNFQRILVQESKNAGVRHQIIMTTSMIDPSLEESDLVRGPAYTIDNKTLDIR